RLARVDRRLHAEHDVADELAGRVDHRLVGEQQAVAAAARAGDALRPLRGQRLARGKGVHRQHEVERLELPPARGELGQRGIPASRPNLAFRGSGPGVRAPTSLLLQPGQPTSAALARSREAGTARPLISSTSVSVWKWNWVFTHARTWLGTYSSQIAGGSTM